MFARSGLVIVHLLVPSLIATAGMPARAAERIDFQRDVRPILSNHCFRCHGPDAAARQADLRLDVRAAMTQVAESGKTIVVAGDVGASELWRRITTEQADERMPPAEAKLALSTAQILTLRRWIEQGAAWQEHWAYAPLVRPALPAVARRDAALNPIDRFVLARLEREGLDFSARSDAVTLARRLAFDLNGLPPTSADVFEFARDPNEQVYAAMVERRLASPAYGERMAVHWLDLVRYADSCGYHSDVEQPISPYRDYVIRAFNENRPFDQFTREQLAGDLLPAPTLDERVATGFNRLNKTTEEGGAQAGEYLAKSAADRVRTTAGVWLAATLGCAECHDHKYDPLTTVDFYRFAALFADVQEEGVWRPGGRQPELAVPSAEQAARQAEIADAISALERRVAAADTQSSETAGLNEQLAALKRERAELEKSIPRTMVTVSVTPRTMRVLARGNWLDTSGAVVGPALPAFLAPATAQGRMTRLDLANWLVARDNPLTARVAINRLWKLMFGAGLARRLDDFGAQGEPPTHPELLDWLAAEFIDSGWNVKHLLRLMATSRVYQQTSAPSDELARRDPQNRLLARQGRWRLEAEFVRDAALAISGQLVTRVGGPSVKPYQPDGYWEFLNFPKRTWKADQGANQYRRGLYTHWQRTFLHPSLLAFDAPSREECVAERSASNTPQAALALLNDPTYSECAGHFAQRALGQTQGDDAWRLAWAWREALARDPEPAELDVLIKLLADSRAANASQNAPATELAAWTAVARTILNLSEAMSRN